MIGLEQRAVLELQQKMAMSPRLLQALGLLQLPVLELAGALETELQENPLLEAAEDDFGEAPRSETEPGRTETGEWDMEAFLADDSGFRSPRSLARHEAAPLENMPSSGQTLGDDLRFQWHVLELSDHERAIGDYLIDCINDDGYLRITRDDLPQSLAAQEDFDRVLILLQGLEPAGIFARDLRECLELQIQRLQGLATLPGRIITDQFDMLGAGRFAELADALGVSRDEVLEAVTWIRENLSPRPGAGFARERVMTAFPDLAIQKRDGQWMVLVNESPFPRLRINGYYSGLYRAGGFDAEVAGYLRDRLDRAMWVLRAVEQRRSTLTRIGQAFLELQPGFFEHGPAHLRRMTLADVAEIVEVHISTVSRAAAGKYVQTPFGVFALKDFFQSGVDTKTGGDRSASSVKRLIAELVNAEDHRHPLSDDGLAEALRKRGLVIARRTVSKYREEAGILPSRLRIRTIRNK